MFGVNSLQKTKTRGENTLVCGKNTLDITFKREKKAFNSEDTFEQHLEDKTTLDNLAEPSNYQH